MNNANQTVKQIITQGQQVCSTIVQTKKNGEKEKCKKQMCIVGAALCSSRMVHFQFFLRVPPTKELLLSVRRVIFGLCCIEDTFEAVILDTYVIALCVIIIFLVCVHIFAFLPLLVSYFNI